MLESIDLLLSNSEIQQKEKFKGNNADKLLLKNADINEELGLSSKWNIDSETTTSASTECSIQKTSKRRKNSVVDRANSHNFICKTSKNITKRKENTKNTLKEYYNVIKKVNISRSNDNDKSFDESVHR